MTSFLDEIKQCKKCGRIPIIGEPLFFGLCKNCDLPTGNEEEISSAHYRKALELAVFDLISCERTLREIEKTQSPWARTATFRDSVYDELLDRCNYYLKRAMDDE